MPDMTNTPPQPEAQATTQAAAEAAPKPEKVKDTTSAPDTPHWDKPDEPGPLSFEFYPVEEGGEKQWRFRLKAANGEIIAEGESYKNKKDCMHAMKAMEKAIGASWHELDLAGNRVMQHR